MMDEPFQLTIRLRSPVIFSGWHFPIAGTPVRIGGSV